MDNETSGVGGGGGRRMWHVGDLRIVYIDQEGKVILCLMGWDGSSGKVLLG